VFGSEKRTGNKKPQEGSRKIQKKRMRRRTREKEGRRKRP
jgi:hypothetical protein